MKPIRFDNTYARELEGFYAPWPPDTVPAPLLLRLNVSLAEELGLDVGALDAGRTARVFSGNEPPAGATPIAQAYAGHQFGGFSPQLGDGRALVLGEVIDRHGHRRDIALKGSGRTPFSRGGDGKAAVGPVLREYLIGEAMHALGIPTTRALAAVGTGEIVARERPLPGAVLTRVAASHLRVGTFQFFAARGEHDKVRRLADYAIARHGPHLADGPDLPPPPDRYAALLRTVAERQASLLADWMLVGFIHGVMNTDNMSISGETIDYGPCAFMEGYDPQTVFSSIDTGGRYAYGNQPAIAQWNLARFAETLLPLMTKDQAMEVIAAFPSLYEDRWLVSIRAKLGLAIPEAGDAALAKDWLTLLHTQQVDFTLAWRRLADLAGGQPEPLTALFEDTGALHVWLDRYQHRVDAEPGSAVTRAERMRRSSPIYIPRNHRVEEALTAASDHSDLGPFDRLLDVITHPFEERPDHEDYSAPAPLAVTACYQTFCGT
jgi:serine/tyrosine/threonine adenylyltransferase